MRIIIEAGQAVGVTGWVVVERSMGTDREWEVHKHLTQVSSTVQQILLLKTEYCLP